MNIKQLDYLLAVAELRSFSKAADKCFITQSTLSTMVGRFEDEIGIRIFDRKTKPVSITKEGSSIIDQLKRISGEISVLNELVQNVKGELSGELKIGVIPTVAPYLLPEFLNDFAEHFPKVKFSVSEMTTATIVELLVRRELDIGILAIPMENQILKEIPLYNEPFVLYDCSQKSKENYVSLDNINFDNFWLLAEGHCLRTQVNRICDLDTYKNKDGINFDFKAGSIESLIRFVKINKGMTMLPYLASLDFTAREHKKITNFQSPIPVRTIGLVVHRHFVKKKLLRYLEMEIKARIQPLLDFDKNQMVISPL